MSFFENHYEYIKACATIRAWEIAYKTGLHDIDDYKQEMFLYLIRHVDSYQPERSCPHTFINLLMNSAKLNILRSLASSKNRIISQAEELEYAK